MIELPAKRQIGELLDFERKFLFEKVVIHKPNIVLEIGTGSCGSTFYIAEALVCLNSGVMHTCDPSNAYGFEFVKQDRYAKIVKFYQMTGASLIGILKSSNIVPDFVFFDGPEDPNMVIDDFLELENFVQSGCVFMAHDWECDRKRIDGNTSVKSSKLKPYLHANNKWVIIEELSGVSNEYPNDSGYNSVGMVYAIKQ